MARVKHNALHNFTAGFNTSPSLAGINLPFSTPGMQGWKVVMEDWATGMSIAADSALYQYTTIGTGSVSLPGNNGLRINNDGGDNDGVIIQAISPNVLFTDNTKKFYMEASVTLTATTIAQNEWFVGWTGLQGTTIGDFVAADGTTWAFDDGFGFGHLDADTTISFFAAQNNTGSAYQTVAGVSDLVTATRSLLQLYYDGANYNLYMDGILQLSVAQTTFNNDAAMGFVVFHRAGAAENNDFEVQYQLIATEL